MDRNALIYNFDFQNGRDKKIRYAARTILAILNDSFDVKSICDLGCGPGTWLSIASETFGKGDPSSIRIDGFDGYYLDTNLLYFDKKHFHAVDLSEPVDDKWKTDRYDLAICLEVAEHLLNDRAESFVSDLCDISDLVLFSAATKLQTGPGHVNEQRLSYWIKLFQGRGYRCLDIIRRKIWDDTDIPVYYRQNTLVFTCKDVPEQCAEYEIGDDYIDVIHPDLYESRMIECLSEKLLLNLIRMQERKNVLGDYLASHGIRRIAIYGVTEIGERLYYELTKEENHKVSVLYFIDPDRKKHDHLRVYGDIDGRPEVDCVIVTSLVDNELLFCRLQKKIKQVLSIYDVLRLAVFESTKDEIL